MQACSEYITPLQMAETISTLRREKGAEGETRAIGISKEAFYSEETKRKIGEAMHRRYKMLLGGSVLFTSSETT